VLGGATPPPPPSWDAVSLTAELQALQEAGHSSNAAAKLLAERTGHSKRELYALLHQESTAPDPLQPDH
jgi:16S rRNA (cytidine1402-2'-O)-methyltransferase